MSDAYRAVLAEVQKKLGGVTTEAVRQRRERIQRIVSMPNDMALFIVARQVGVQLNRFVRDAATLESVATFEERLAAKESRPAAPAAPTRPRARTQAAAPKVIHIGGAPLPEGVLTEKHLREAVRMGDLYPMMYVFENSVREFIDGHLAANYTVDWWNDPNLKLVSRPVRQVVETAMKAEAENRYHSARHTRPLYYTTLGNLVLIVASEDGVKVFKRPVFPRPSWFPELIESFEVSRNIVAHMNPIQPRDIRRMKMAYDDWFAQIKDRLPPPVP